MATIKPDFKIIRGDSSSIAFTLLDKTTPVDITDTEIFFTAKPALTNDLSDNTAVISVEVTDHDDPENGFTVIPLSSTDTNVPPGEYYYDVQIKRGSDTITSIVARKLEVIADVTRRTS